MEEKSVPGYVAVGHEIEGEPKQVLMVISQEAFISLEVVKPE